MRSIYAMGSEKTFEGTHRNQRPDNGLLSFASNAVRCAYRLPAERPLQTSALATATGDKR